ncbi:MAG TPA: hypothetical protein DCS93_37115 [Microscillaceae bacterium]|nr:hypothetical protein [Microscillaceae bacterium]
MEKLKWFSYVLLLVAAQGVLLMVILRKIPRSNKQANFYLSGMIGLVILAMIGRLAFDPQFFNYFPHLVIIADVFIFLFGPFFYFYVRSVLQLPTPKLKHQLLHFIPALLHFFSMIPQIILSKKTYMHMMMVERTPWLYAVWLGFEGAALVLNFAYLYASYIVVQRHANDSQMKVYRKYLQTILVLLLVCLVGWMQGYVLYFFKFKSLLSFIGSNLGWLLPTGITYFLGYLTAIKPALFQIPETPKVKYQNSPLAKADVKKHQTKLEQFMTSQQPYLDAQLTLQTLATLLDMKPAQLSQIINEGYQKNFFDFVNTYRVQHFIQLASLQANKHKTLLGIALEVGFNSKSTFNRAFKKEYQVTPTAYIKQMELTSY